MDYTLTTDPELVENVRRIIEFLGTFAFAISGIRHAAACRFDWFGGFVCGVCVAIGGGTLRDVMLGVTPFWMTSPFYIVCTLMAQVFVILFARSLKRLDNAWFVFDTLTGSAGGVIRDLFLNRMPLIFRKEIYAMASIVGGVLYWLLLINDAGVGMASVVTFFFICLVRALAMKYHISLPQLRLEDEEKDE